MRKLQAIIAPHAPTLLEIEMDGKQNTIIDTLHTIGDKLRCEKIDTVVVATTHWQSDQFYIDPSPIHRTLYDYYGFRTSLQYDAPGHPEFAALLKKAGDEHSIFPEYRKHGADHAITVPMHFMFPEIDVPVIPLSVSGTLQEAFRWGEVIRNVVIRSDKNVLFLASGSLAHDLEAWLHHETNANHSLFDQSVLDLLRRGEGMELTNMDRALVAEGKPEGGFRDLFMLLGFMGSACPGEVLAYESVPGVGMGVVWFETEVIESHAAVTI